MPLSLRRIVLNTDNKSIFPIYICCRQTFFLVYVFHSIALSRLGRSVFAGGNDFISHSMIMTDLGIESFLDFQPAPLNKI